MRALGAILGRDLTAFRGSAVAPVLLAGFLLLTGYTFTGVMLGYSELSLSALTTGREIQDTLNLSDGVFQPLVSSMTVFLILLLPAVSMRVFAEEFRSGRYELLITYPVDERTWVLGKFLGAWIVGLSMIAVAGAYFAVAAWLGHPEVGPLLAALTGLVLVSALITAWGVFFSTLVSHQIVSYILGFAFAMLLYAIGDLEPHLPEALGRLTERLSLGLHLHRFTRGLIDSRDLVYFLGLSVLGLSAATASLAGRRTAGARRLGRWVPVILLGALVVVVDIIAAGAPWTADLTRNRRNSLAPQTHQVLAALDDDVHVTAFYQRLDPRRKPVESMLAAFARHCDRFSYEVLNPDLEPTLVGELGVSAPRAVIVEAVGRRRSVLDPDEGVLINTVFRVIEDRQPVIRHLQGHGERRTDDDQGPGYAAYARTLGKQGYVLKNLLLLETGSVPVDTDVLVIAQPQSELSFDELAAIQQYVDLGGAVLVLQDPGGPASLDRWLGNFNIEPGNDFILSRSGRSRQIGLDERITVLMEYGPHEITRGLDGWATLFPLPQTLQPLNRDLAGLDSRSFLLSEPESWGETDTEAFGRGIAAFDEAVDRRGPQTFGVAVEIDLREYLARHAVSDLSAPEAEVDGPARLFLDRLRGRAGTPEELPPSVFSQGADARLAVIGDADFASNAYLNLYGNRDLLLNAVGWLARERTLIAVRARAAVSEPLVLSRDSKRWLGWGCIAGWPLLVGGLTTVGVIRRRRRG